MMVDMLLTAGVVAVLGWLAVWKSSPHSGPFAFDKGLSGYLKGFCAIIVVLTHVPAAYGNPIQQAIHSFGFVAVTLFFLISAYGMSFSAERSPANYLAHFWRNRLASLLVPWILVQLCWAIYAVGAGNAGIGGFFRALFRFPLYVSVLLQYCLLFFVVVSCRERGWFGARTALAVQVLVVAVSSLLLYVFGGGASSALVGWPRERLGLVWGLLLFYGFPRIVAWAELQRGRKTILAGLLAAGLGIAYLAFKSAWFWGGFLLRTAMGLAIIVFVLLAIQKHRLGNAATDWLGRISYEVYLSHDLTMSVLKHHFPGLGSGLFILLSLLLTLLYSSCIHALASRLVAGIRSVPVRPGRP